MTKHGKALGYVTHAAQNRRRVARYVLGYIAAFQLIGAFALTVPLLVVDPLHTIVSDPGGYALRYALPLALVSGLIFRHIYLAHADAVRVMVEIREVTRADEPRFVSIAEEQCTALGVRAPHFGVIDEDAPNALTVGQGPARGLIAVTRGLLELLDDDELAAVLAHEASHIRNGDTKVLSANYALMRTAVALQVNNPLRLEDWRQMILPLAFPPMLPVLIAGSAATKLAMRLAFAARREVKLTRDHIADGEAVRMTHFPEALLSALGKVGGRGEFRGSHRVEALLFDGPSDHEGGTHPPVAERIDAITTLGRELMDPARIRRDTRELMRSRPHFGLRGKAAPAQGSRCDRYGRPLEKPATPNLALTLMQFTDPPAYRQWRDSCWAWYEWRATDTRNALGMTPQMLIPVAAVTAFLFVFHWPTDNDPRKFAATFNPALMAQTFDMVRVGGTFCEGPSYPDGNCNHMISQPTEAALQPPSPRPNPWSPGPSAPVKQPGRAAYDDGIPVSEMIPGNMVARLMFSFALLVIFAPSKVKWLFGVVEPKAGKSAFVPDHDLLLAAERELLSSTPARQDLPPSVQPRPPVSGFGRKRV
jgi:Zn-dependent protease with chaperone function